MRRNEIDVPLTLLSTRTWTRVIGFSGFFCSGLLPSSSIYDKIYQSTKSGNQARIKAYRIIRCPIHLTSQPGFDAGQAL